MTFRPIARENRGKRGHGCELLDLPLKCRRELKQQRSGRHHNGERRPNRKRSAPLISRRRAALRRDLNRRWQIVVSHILLPMISVFLPVIRIAESLRDW